MVRAEVCRWGVTTRRSVEHATQPHAIHHAAMHAKPDNATRALVHHHEHPVSAEDGRFAPKQIDAPQTVLRVHQNREPDGPAGSGFGCYRTVKMRRTTSLLMGIPKARVICSAIRGQPPVGFRSLMSTMAAVTSSLA